MISFIVKGSIEDARKSASERCIAVHSLTYHRVGGIVGECHGKVTDEYTGQMIRWFCEPGDAPFPLGTLLHYSLPKESSNADSDSVESLRDACRLPSPGGGSNLDF
jgi:hypothetical protein